MGLDIQSKEVIDKISDELKVQPSLEIPRELAEKIQLVYNVNKVMEENVVVSAEKTTTGTTVILLTPTDRDFFLTGLYLAVAADAASDSVIYFQNVAPFGKAITRILAIEKISLTALNKISFITFPKPIKLERGSNITHTGAFTVGVSQMQSVVFGYTTDPQ